MTIANRIQKSHECPRLSSTCLCAAGGLPEQNVAHLHLVQRGEEGLPAAGGPAAGQSPRQSGGEIHGDGRRRGQHRLGQHEGESRRHLKETRISCVCARDRFSEILKPSLHFPSLFHPLPGG